MRRAHAALAAALCVAPLRLAAQSPADATARTLRAGRTDGPIRLDAVFDEPSWQTADSIVGLTQVEPGEGVPESQRTVVRVLAGEAGVYIGFWGYQDPRTIVRSHLRRDADFESDDMFAFLFDPQQDRRSAYAFAVNANGAMTDGEVKGEDVGEDWNGVWDARARITSDGWVAEVFVPWQTLRYRQDAGSWGFNVFRLIRHRNEYLLWTSWQRQFGFFYLPGAGTLEGLGPLPRRRLVEARPYVSSTGSMDSREFDAAGADSVTAAAEVDADFGLDAKVAVAPTLTLDLTTNTDFAQVEADRQVVNLTRFPTFFPEKRPFFLESSDIFDFGQRERLLLFHSRRIGLSEDGTPIPISWGARLSGRVGPERVGLLAARTAGSEDAVDVVARVKHDALSRGYVGAMLTAQTGPGIAGTRLAAGSDFRFPLLLNGKNLIPEGFVAVSQDSSGARRPSAWRFFLDYPNDHADHFLTVSRIEAGFNPALGFVRQDGVLRYNGAFRFYPRPRRMGIRRLVLMPLNFDVSTSLSGSLDNASYEVRPIGLEFESGAEFELNLQRRQDVPSDSFEIFEGVVLAPGRYTFHRAEVQLETSSARPVSFSLTADVGDFYSGTGVGIEAGLTLRAAPHVIASVDAERQAARLPEGDFTAYAVRVRLDYAASPRLASALFLQYDNENERLAVNVRLHFIPRPGSDAYLVWNSAWPTGLDRGVPWKKPLRGALVGKVVYYFQL